MERDMTSRGALAADVDDLQASGRLTFTREEAMLALGVSSNALKQSVLRLAARRRVVSVRRGFYVIVPLEHREVGIPPLGDRAGGRGAGNGAGGRAAAAH